MEIDTIAAIATAPGMGAVAVVRLSGTKAFSILRRVAPELSGLPGERSATLVTLRDPRSGEAIDRGLATCFRRPRSYTGEDVVELSCHGGWLSPALLLEACLAAGARRAEPGEFTRRAYLNGKMDLVQAEAVADLVGGRNRALHRAAIHHLERGLSARIAGLREGLVELEALLVHHIDFPEEDDAPVPVEDIAVRGERVVRALEGLLETAPEGQLLREGALAVLAGPPNSGKSSLFNALVGEERAIVTELPGTTRDAVDAPVSMGGFPFRLVDTAGLRSAEDVVERLGVEVAERYLARADVVLFCAEAGRALEPGERRFLVEQGGPVVVVRTKTDLRTEEPAEADGLPDLPTVEVSVVTGEGLGALRERLPRMVYRGLVTLGSESPVLTRERQRRAVERAHGEVRSFVEALRGGVPPELAASHLRPAETGLEELVGTITADEVLDRVFRDFCIGK